LTLCIYWICVCIVTRTHRESTSQAFWSDQQGTNSTAAGVSFILGFGRYLKQRKSQLFMLSLVWSLQFWES
jgi:hypothetical protein